MSKLPVFALVGALTFAAGCSGNPPVYQVSGTVTKSASFVASPSYVPLIGYSRQESDLPISTANPGSFTLVGYTKPDATTGKYSLGLASSKQYALFFVSAWNDLGQANIAATGTVIASPSYAVAMAKGKIVDVEPFNNPGGSTASVDVSSLNFAF